MGSIAALPLPLPSCQQALKYTENQPNQTRCSALHCARRPNRFSPVVGVFDESYSAKPAQLISPTGPPGHIEWTGHGGSSLC